MSYHGPALAINKFYVSVSENSARIAFSEAENNEQPPEYRTGVVMSIDNLKELGGLIQHLLDGKTVQ